MAILDFQKPEKVIMLESTDFRGQFEFRPLEPGYGITVGNALRRILLNSLEGFAITAIKIEGVDHEFSTIKGVVEDVTEMVLNLKQVRFKRQIEDSETEEVNITVSGQETFTAGDIGKFTSSFQVLNTDHVICHMEKSVKFNMQITIQKGRIVNITERKLQTIAGQFSIRADAQSWRKHWQKIPQRDYHDIFAMLAKDFVNIDGDLVPLMQNLQYFKDLISKNRES